MTQDNRLIPLLLESIAYRSTPKEEEAASEPPYTLPAVLTSFYEVAAEVLRCRMEESDENPLGSERLLESPAYFSDMARNWLNGGDLDVSDPVCVLLAGGIISVETVEQAIKVCTDHLSPKFMQRAIVYRLCAEGKLDDAIKAADSEIFGDEKWTGWRAVGDYLARNGDDTMFFKLWAKYKATLRRDYIDRMRIDLIDAISRRRGWREAVEVAHDKRMNPKSHENGLIYVALRPLTETCDAKTMDKLLNTENLPDLDEPARLQLLIDAMLASYPKSGEPGYDADHPDLVWVLPRIVAIDPTISKEMSRRRDSLLVDMWSVIGNSATLKQVRSAIRTPMFKRELMQLKGM